MSLLEVNHLQKVYATRFGGNKVEALKNVNFTVEDGEFVAIMGESGSGKTTLLNILAALDRPTSGNVLLKGKDFTQIKEAEVAAFRRDHLGFVFQEFNLLDTFTLEDNIYLPLVLAGKSYEEMHRRLMPIADKLGITALLKKYPYEVSGGQKQRAAVARAMITDPRIILADEPTGALDSKATDELLELFSQVNRSGQTILMVTHDVDKAGPFANKVLCLSEGACNEEALPQAEIIHAHAHKHAKGEGAHIHSANCKHEADHHHDSEHCPECNHHEHDHVHELEKEEK